MLARAGSSLLLGLLLVGQAVAQDIPGPALAVFNAYLAQAARTVTAYRMDIRIGDDPKDAGAGRLPGQSAFLGSFTYRPATYAELSRPERALLVHDPQFHAFLASLRPPAAVGFHFTLTPEEMLRSRPFVIVLPP